MREIGLYAAEFLFGICSGGAAAAGVFALITVIGIIPRMADFSHTAVHIHKYEWAVIAGGTAGNLWYLLCPSFTAGSMGYLLELAAGLAYGMFVGSLVMALAEVWQVFPILIRRTRLRIGISYLGLALALGRTVGALIYFLEKK